MRSFNSKLHFSGYVPYLLILTILFLWPVLDFLSTNLDSRANILGKGSLCLLVVLVAVLLSKARQRLIIFSFFLIPPAIIYSFTSEGVDEYLMHINYIVKCVLVVFFYALYMSLSSRQFFRTIEYTKMSVILYGVFILLGFVFSIDSFRSYETSIRFGYKGIMLSQNEATGLLSAGLLIFGWLTLIKYSRLHILGCLVMALSLLLLGTKGGAFALLLCVMVFFYSKYSFYKMLLYTALLLLGITMLVFLGGMYSEVIRKAINSNYLYFNHQWEFYAQRDLLSFLSSGRNFKISQIVAIVVDSPFYIVAGGYPMSRYMAEVDFIDMILSIGVVSFVFYIYLLKNAFSIGERQRYRWYPFLSFCVVILLANTGGHVLTSALAAPYLAALASLFSRRYVEKTSGTQCVDSLQN